MGARTPSTRRPQSRQCRRPLPRAAGGDSAAVSATNALFSGTAKQSFGDSGITKQELGNERKKALRKTAQGKRVERAPPWVKSPNGHSPQRGTTRSLFCPAGACALFDAVTQGGARAGSGAESGCTGVWEL